MKISEDWSEMWSELDLEWPEDGGPEALLTDEFCGSVAKIVLKAYVLPEVRTAIARCQSLRLSSAVRTNLLEMARAVGFRGRVADVVPPYPLSLDAG